MTVFCAVMASTNVTGAMVLKEEWKRTFEVAVKGPDCVVAFKNRVAPLNCAAPWRKRVLAEMVDVNTAGVDKNVPP